jgi:hypothetical protein
MKLRSACLLAAAMLGLTCIPPEKPAKSGEIPKECPKPPPEPEMYAMVIGTVLEYHLVNSGYPFSKIGDAMDVFRPDLIVIDQPPDVLKERPEEASVEVEYVKYVAGTRASDVESIDTSRVDPEIVTTTDNADESQLKAAAEYLDTLTGLGFPDANSNETGLKILAAVNTQQRLAKGAPNYTRRQAWLEKGINDVIARKKPKRVMAVVYLQNRPAVEAHLRQLGAGVKNPVDMTRAAKEAREENSVPPLVIKAWTQQLDRLKDRLSRMKKDSEAKKYLQRQANIIQAAVDRNGACCVSPQRFETGKK